MSKLTKKATWKQRRLHKNAYKKTLRIHPGCSQARPLTAPFHRLKRRFWPFCQQKQVLNREKKTYFCTIFVNFGRNLHIYAYSCIALLIYALNPQYTTKQPQNDRKNTKQKWVTKKAPAPKRHQNVLKMVPKWYQNDAEMVSRWP